VKVKNCVICFNRKLQKKTCAIDLGFTADALLKQRHQSKKSKVSRVCTHGAESLKCSWIWFLWHV